MYILLNQIYSVLHTKIYTSYNLLYIYLCLCSWWQCNQTWFATSPSRSSAHWEKISNQTHTSSFSETHSVCLSVSLSPLLAPLSLETPSFRKVVDRSVFKLPHSEPFRGRNLHVCHNSSTFLTSTGITAIPSVLSHGQVKGKNKKKSFVYFMFSFLVTPFFNVE